MNECLRFSIYIFFWLYILSLFRTNPVSTVAESRREHEAIHQRLHREIPPCFRKQLESHRRCRRRRRRRRCCRYEKERPQNVCGIATRILREVSRLHGRDPERCNKFYLFIGVFVGIVYTICMRASQFFPI